MAPASITPQAALAGEAAAGVSAEDLRSALKAWQRLSKSRLPGERIEAVRALGALTHEDVAARLAKFIRSEQDDEVLDVAFQVVARQKPVAKKIVAQIAERLTQEAEVERVRLAKGDLGIRVDPRTGNTDTQSVEGKERDLAMRRRGAMLAAAFNALAELGWDPGRAPPDLTPFLQDPSDDLVVGALAWIGRWKVRSALGPMLELFKMYPTESTWETGAVVDLAGTNATAKAKWMLLFGHPDKQCARPKVVTALLAALEQVAGQPLESPEQLAAYLANGGAKGTPHTKRAAR